MAKKFVGQARNWSFSTEYARSGHLTVSVVLFRPNPGNSTSNSRNGRNRYRRTARQPVEKGADRGIDGNIYFAKTSRAIVSIEAGDYAGVAMIRDLCGTLELEKPRSASS